MSILNPVSVLVILACMCIRGFPGGASGREPAWQCRRHERLGFAPRVGRIPWRREQLPTPVLLPGESHGQRSVVALQSLGPQRI